MTTQPQIQTPHETPTPLELEDLQQLIKEVIERGYEEAKYILIVNISRRYPGCGWIELWDEKLINILGEYEVIELEYSDNESECQRHAKVAIVPKTVPVIIAKRSEDNDGCETTIYAFDGTGWRSLTIQSCLPYEDDQVVYRL